MLKKNDKVEIQIEDLTVEGSGIGRHEGMAVFVPGGLPGEIVKAQIIKVSKNYAAGKLCNLLHSSPERVQPFCPVFEKCGGCTLQHLSYIKQLEYKSRYIKECFSRIGGIEIDEPQVLPSENTRDYRNKAAFPVSESGGKLEAGLYSRRSHRLVATDCGIQTIAINSIKNAVLEWAKENNISAYDETSGKGILRHIVARQSSCGDLMAGVIVAEKADVKPLIDKLKGIGEVRSIVLNINRENGNVILGTENHLIYGEEYITEKYDGLVFRVGFTSFLQVNHPQSEKLYNVALDFAEIKKDDLVFDLFCGIGTISLLAAKKAKVVLGIEFVQEAVNNARQNASLNGIENATFLAGDAGEKLSEGARITGKPDIIILDPPRKGCEKDILNTIIKISPKKVVYVSCDPATLARDTAILKPGGYRVERVIGVDMFPHTTHVETVILMSRVEK